MIRTRGGKGKGRPFRKREKGGKDESLEESVCNSMVEGRGEP